LTTTNRSVGQHQIIAVIGVKIDFPDPEIQVGPISGSGMSAIIDVIPGDAEPKLQFF
jgi:hypothetical protein